MRKARILYAGEDLGLELENTVYALDSTTIDLSLSLFPWADFRSTKAGIKMHTQLDLRGPIPTCIHISGARKADIDFLDDLLFEAGAFYVMDRAYMDFARLARIVLSGAFFVTRAKSNLRFTRHRSLSRDCLEGVLSDQVGSPSLPKTADDFPYPLRRVRYFDKETAKYLVFLTNNMEIPALTIAKLYKSRWQIELFFKWITKCRSDGSGVFRHDLVGDGTSFPALHAASALFQILGWRSAEITSSANAQAKACLPPFGALRWNKSFFSPVLFLFS
jgi:hypothetical protein